MGLSRVIANVYILPANAMPGPLAGRYGRVGYGVRHAIGGPGGTLGESPLGESRGTRHHGRDHSLRNARLLQRNQVVGLGCVLSWLSANRLQDQRGSSPAPVMRTIASLFRTAFAGAAERFRGPSVELPYARQTVVEKRTGESRARRTGTRRNSMRKTSGMVDAFEPRLPPASQYVPHLERLWSGLRGGLLRVDRFHHGRDGFEQQRAHIPQSEPCIAPTLSPC